PFYIDRPPIEEQCYAEILKPGALIRLRAPSKMGKTSLKNRVLAYAAAQGYHTVRLNFEQADEAVLNNANQFLRWFCANVSRQLGLEPRLDDYWDEDFGSKVSCTIYFQGYILEKLNSPVVLALEEVNQIFEHAEIAQNFLPLLRSWYEEAKDVEIWQKLRLVVVHSTEIYVPLNLNQSPFNVGLPIRLPEFTLAQVQDLALRHGLAWADGEAGTARLAPLLEMVGGHPYRVRIALYHLGRQEMTLEQLLAEAPTLAGIYSHRLRYHWTTLQAYPELTAAMQQVVGITGQVKIAPIPAYKLESMGLIKLKGEGAIPSCELYRLYFRTQLD
ncbi:MAG TPA: AAA-like domain-containing protein, partial [Allocoleopsis sp.]